MPTLNVLKTRLKSPSSNVRQKTVVDLVLVTDYEATAVLGYTMLRDSSLQVRLAAVKALVVRGNRGSSRAMGRAMQAASTSGERAEILKAIKALLGIGE